MNAKPATISMSVRCAKCHTELAAKCDMDAADPECPALRIGPTIWVEPCQECLEKKP